MEQFHWITCFSWFESELISGKFLNDYEYISQSLNMNTVLYSLKYGNFEIVGSLFRYP